MRRLGGYDVEYTNDSLNRLTKAEEGSWNGSAITSRSRQQIWTLTQTGNWDRAKLDLNGDNDFVDSGETDDTRTHNVANELTARDTDSNASNNYTLTYDDDGQLTDDGQSYKYVYDAFGRIRQVKNQSNTVIAEYWYNGLGYRITVLLDTNNSGAADGSDTKFHLAWDERWRQVATFRESDSSPKEQFINHQAGLDGSGGASYIDTVICREKDANTAWTSASDGTLEERRYYCQNWRADVSAVLTSGGLMVEWDKYSSYGSPYGLPGGDANSSGNTDSTDTTQIQTWINGSAYDVRGDVDLDGDVDATDKTRVTNNYVGTTLGWNNLSAVGNRKGYGGYEWESQTAGYHVRHRYLRPELGRWIRRDPLGYVDGYNIYVYTNCSPIVQRDPTGTTSNLEFVPEGHKIDGGGRNPNSEWSMQPRNLPLACLYEKSYAWIVQYIHRDGFEFDANNAVVFAWATQHKPYWEAWQVDSQTFHRFGLDMPIPPYTPADKALRLAIFAFDTSRFNLSRNTKTIGGLGAYGELKLFCPSEVETGSNDENDIRNWKRDPHDGSGAGLLKHTFTKPSWWPGGDLDDFRSLLVNFDLTSYPTSWEVRSDASPAKTGEMHCRSGSGVQGPPCFD